MAAIYSNGGNRWNILGFNFNKRDALSSVYGVLLKFSLLDLSFAFKKVNIAQQHLAESRPVFMGLYSALLINMSRTLCRLPVRDWIKNCVCGSLQHM